ncbi:hypothetical protein BJ322DRAFT_511650 [Thelephora terrestris]|uniref:SET domain-containing protein n=1 Tax=Thelephora terrestris TaxID=56493 RepID=A0A9P6H3B3_9AGAM|nr:hypothetical protein BJ322DRAFT_511650 [Thelephora terrestris]
MAQTKQKPAKTKQQPQPRKSYSGLLLALLVAAFSVLLAIFFGPWSNGSLYSTTNLNETPRPYNVVDIPGKGKGVIATRDITRGELLYKESPLFIVPSQISIPPAELMGKILPTLSKSQRAALFNLSYVRLPPNLSKADHDHDAQLALAITQTNGISAGTRGVGVFPNVSRLNHGCSRAFNAVYNWREKEQKLVVHAIRPIKEGQEILTAYFDTRRPRRERRAYLQEHYDFHCTCAVCSMPDVVSEVSDDRLSQMQNMQNELAQWAQGKIEGDKAIHLINEIWWVGSLEGYWSQRGRLAADAATVALSHSE